MAELTALHFTDLHEDGDKLKAIRSFVQAHSEINAVFFTGDFIGEYQSQQEGTHQKIRKKHNEILAKYVAKEDFQELQQKLSEFLQEHQIREESDVQRLPEEKKKELEEIMQARNSLIQEAVLTHLPELKGSFVDLVNESYKTLSVEFKEITKSAPVYAIMGNHDLTLGYTPLGEAITFLEKQKQAIIKGSTGIEFVVKGDLNSWEVPPAYNDFTLNLALKDYFVNYFSGWSQNHLNQSATNSETEEEKTSWQELSQKAHLYQNQERARLGSKDADIYLAHKLPHCDLATKVIGCASGDIASEYSANAEAAYGGHFHDGQIGSRTLQAVLQEAQTASEKNTVDGKEIPLVYLNDKESWELNPGTDHFFVTEYNTSKEIESLTIYEYVYEN